MKYINRLYDSQLEEYLQVFPCVVILGPRQCGKTSLVRNLSGDWKFFDLEKASDYDAISRDPDLFFRSFNHRVIIDEAQLLPSVFPALRVAVDSNRGRMGRFVLTGSSSPDLLNSISETLAGRVGLIEMGTLTFSETQGKPPSPFFNAIQEKLPPQDFLSLPEAEASLEYLLDYSYRGGYPEPWSRRSVRFHKLWMENYVKTFLERDLKRLFPKIESARFRMFLQSLALMSGTIINYSEIARGLGLSQPTIRDYLEIAHGAFVFRKLPSYVKNPLKRIIKHPKGYYRDSGLLCYLLRIASVQDFFAHPSRGWIFEGLVIENLLRSFHSIGISCDSYHYRTGAGAEVDLVLEGDFGLLPIEIKFSQTVSARNLRGLFGFMDDYGCRLGVVINNDERIRLYRDNIVGIPFAML